MGSIFSAPAPAPVPVPPPVQPRKVVQPREAIREAATDKPKVKTRRRAGAGGGGAALPGPILTASGADSVTPGKKSLLGD